MRFRPELHGGRYGDEDLTIRTLLALPRPTLEKYTILTSLDLSGQIIQADLIILGIQEKIEIAKKEWWRLHEPFNSIAPWLALLPFSDRPHALIEAFQFIDSRFLEPSPLRELLSALRYAPSPNAEKLLKELAQINPIFYTEYEWLKATCDRDITSSATTFLDILCERKLTDERRYVDPWMVSKYFVAMIERHPHFRQEVLRRYKEMPSGASKMTLLDALAESPDEDTAILLATEYQVNAKPFDETLYRAIKNVVIEKRPLSKGESTYNLCPVDVSLLRVRLFGMFNGNPAQARLAEDCLNTVDELRDEYDGVDIEPRHSDITLAKPWPLVAE